MLYEQIDIKSVWNKRKRWRDELMMNGEWGSSGWRVQRERERASAHKRANKKWMSRASRVCVCGDGRGGGGRELKSTFDGASPLVPRHHNSSTFNVYVMVNFCSISSINKNICMIRTLICLAGQEQKKRKERTANCFPHFTLYFSCHLARADLPARRMPLFLRFSVPLSLLLSLRLG